MKISLRENINVTEDFRSNLKVLLMFLNNDKTDSKLFDLKLSRMPECTCKNSIIYYNMCMYLFSKTAIVTTASCIGY